MKDKLNVLGENTEKCKTIFVWIEKEIRKVYEDGNEDIITIFYKKKLLPEQVLW